MGRKSKKSSNPKKSFDSSLDNKTTTPAPNHTIQPKKQYVPKNPSPKSSSLSLSESPKSEERVALIADDLNFDATLSPGEQADPESSLMNESSMEPETPLMNESGLEATLNEALNDANDEGTSLDDATNADDGTVEGTESQDLISEELVGMMVAPPVTEDMTEVITENEGTKDVTEEDAGSSPAVVDTIQLLDDSPVVIASLDAQSNPETSLVFLYSRWKEALVDLRGVRLIGPTLDFTQSSVDALMRTSSGVIPLIPSSLEGMDRNFSALLDQSDKKWGETMEHASAPCRETVRMVFMSADPRVLVLLGGDAFRELSDSVKAKGLIATAANTTAWFARECVHATLDLVSDGPTALLVDRLGAANEHLRCAMARLEQQS